MYVFEEIEESHQSMCLSDPLISAYVLYTKLATRCCYIAANSVFHDDFHILLKVLSNEVFISWLVVGHGIRHPYQSWDTGSLIFQPYFLASFTAVPSSAAWCMSFLGMQPTFTHVPPRPHLVPVPKILA